MAIIWLYLQVIIIGIITLIPMSNPLTATALMLNLGARLPESERQRQAKNAAIYTFAIMVGAFYFGQFVMRSFGISIPGLRIAGGLIVTLIGFSMLFPQANNDQNQRTKEEDHGTVSNIAFIPLAMPGTAGPGAIAMIVSVSASLQNYDKISLWITMTAPIFSFLFMAFLLWIALRSATHIMDFLGHDGIDAIARLMGFLLICMGVQFCINGVIDIVDQYQLDKSAIIPQDGEINTTLFEEEI